jgi:hypothetical protein
MLWRAASARAGNADKSESLVHSIARNYLRARHTTLQTRRDQAVCTRRRTKIILRATHLSDVSTDTEQPRDNLPVSALSPPLLTTATIS